MVIVHSELLVYRRVNHGLISNDFFWIMANQTFITIVDMQTSCLLFGHGLMTIPRLGWRAQMAHCEMNMSRLNILYATGHHTQKSGTSNSELTMACMTYTSGAASAAYIHANVFCKV